MSGVAWLPLLLHLHLTESFQWKPNFPSPDTATGDCPCQACAGPCRSASIPSIPTHSQDPQTKPTETQREQEEVLTKLCLPPKLYLLLMIF